jgi:hypothetical protein
MQAGTAKVRFNPWNFHILLVLGAGQGKIQLLLDSLASLVFSNATNMAIQLRKVVLQGLLQRFLVPCLFRRTTEELGLVTQPDRDHRGTEAVSWLIDKMRGFAHSLQRVGCFALVQYIGRSRCMAMGVITMETCYWHGQTGKLPLLCNSLPVC